jgi:hypothetical protein
MARKTSTKAKVATSATTVPDSTTATSFQNLGIEWRTKPDGSAELVVAYAGPLAGRDEVIARAGTWRQGSEPWAETTELPLKRQGARWVGAIPVRPGAPVEAVEFVFRAGDEWDNGGRAPLGYYEWNPRQGCVEIR